MNLCTIHPHSTPKKAEKCHHKWIQKRVDLKTKYFLVPPVVMVTYPKCRRVTIGGVEYFIFSEDVNMPYGQMAELVDAPDLGSGG